MFGKQFLNIAHRGYETRAPENTFAAFEMAMARGADGFEIDVQLTKDREIVVIHDHTLERTTNGTGRVKDKTLDELKGLDAGSWFDPNFRDERIPTLNEILDCYTGSAIVDIEIKDAGFSPRLPKKVVETIKLYHAEESVYVSSFNPLALWYVKRLNSKIKTKIIGFYEPHDPHEKLLNRALLFFQRLAKKEILFVARPDIIDIHHGNLTPDLARRFKRSGRATAVSILETKKDMERVMDLGADIIITRNPRLLKWTISQRSQSYSRPGRHSLTKIK